MFNSSILIKVSNWYLKKGAQLTKIVEGAFQ